MANDHHQAKDLHHHGTSSSSNNNDMRSSSKKNRTTTLPPVPSAHPSLLQSAQRAHPAVPIADPEAMPAKQGLNEWGAFTGGSNSSDSGTFGLGPLLFRHSGADELETSTAPSPPLTGRELVEMDRLLRNDPASFNPMQAISWAKLDRDIVEQPPPLSVQQKKERESTAKATSKTESSREGGEKLEYQQGRRESASGASTKASACQSDRVEYGAYNGSSTAPIGTAVSTSSARDGYQRSSESIEPTPSPVGNMAQTFSNMDMTGTDGYGVFAPSAAPVVSSPNTTHRAASTQPQVRQQRKHRHRHGKKTGPTSTDMFAQQQASHQPSTFPTSTSSIPVTVSTQQQPYPAQYQVTYTDYSRTSPSDHSFQPHPVPPPPPPPPQQQVIGLLLCLAPSCQARFSSEAQLNAHYQAAHAAVAQPSLHCGRQHSYSSSSSDSLGCSWTSCGAGGFTSNNALVWHVKAEHLLLCPVPGCCDRVFPSRKQLDGHVRNRVVQ